MPITRIRGTGRSLARLGITAATGLGLMIALSACTPSAAGGDAELKSGSEQAAFDDWQSDFTDCMKDEGVDMGATAAMGEGEGFSESGDSIQLDAGEIDPEAWESASKVCNEKLGEMPIPPGMVEPKEMQESLLAFAKCMREAGYDYPDPEIQSDDGGSGGITIHAMPTEEYDTAVMDECSEQAGLPDAGIRMGVTGGDQ